MYKDILTKDQISDPTLRGLQKIAGIVKRTLGPGGLPIIIERYGQQALDGSPLGPRITKDGVSVANECSSKDKEEDLIIQAVKSICKKTNSDAGDGTTTAIVLGEAIVLEIKKVLTDLELNPQQVKESVEDALKGIIKELDEMASPVKDLEKIKQVATISANGDESIGEIIGNAFDHVGAEGVVTVDEGHGLDVSLNVVDGYQFNRGAESRQNFFNNKNLTHYEAENARIILYDGKLLNFADIIPALTVLVGGLDPNGAPNRPMPPTIIVANEFSSDVLQFLLIQNKQKGMQFCPVRGPHTTHVRTGYYDDLAYYTGGTRMGNGNRALNNITDDDIGLVSKVIIDKYKTTFYDGQGDEDDLLKRVDQLKAAKKEAESSYDAQVINDRIAALTGGVAKIGVGGATEFEIKEKYDRIEDALNAARAAIQQGVVPGGGFTLARIARKLSNEEKPTIGQEILGKALKYPMQQILENIGISELTDSEVDRIFNTENLVFDARHRKVVDAMESGIIDPVKVTKSALINAVSIASLLSTAGGAIIYRTDS